MIVNGCFWAAGLEAKIPEKTDVEIVGDVQADAVPVQAKRRVEAWREACGVVQVMPRELVTQ